MTSHPASEIIYYIYYRPGDILCYSNSFSDVYFIFLNNSAVYIFKNISGRWRLGMFEGTMATAMIQSMFTNKIA